MAKDNGESGSSRVHPAVGWWGSTNSRGRLLCADRAISPVTPGWYSCSGLHQGPGLPLPGDGGREESAMGKTRDKWAYRIAFICFLPALPLILGAVHLLEFIQWLKGRRCSSGNATRSE